MRECVPVQMNKAVSNTLKATFVFVSYRVPNFCLYVAVSFPAAELFIIIFHHNRAKRKPFASSLRS